MISNSYRIIKKKRKKKEVSFSRFAAIDFETADYGRDSACAVSVIVAENGKIINKFYSLIRPPRRDFIFTNIHGITWDDVADKPSFHELWPQMRQMLSDIDFIAAHNASFDRSVLYTCCRNARLMIPQTDFICTVKLARYVWNIFPTKLPDVCRYLDIPLKHHDALSDTLACAKIVLAVKNETIPVCVFLERNR
ncbi:MAG TPA: 3'-5' exonuclease [Chitinispirillaceae bacterium]|nr:3'-5' exonuclease [Chitinispirillaceae bacterium]